MSKVTRKVLDYCADLLSETKNEAFMLGLFERPKAEWVGVRDLCSDVHAPVPPQAGPGKDLMVVWLDEPDRLDDYSTIVFFSPSELWSTAAIYNRKRLLRERSLSQPS
jgi:hypothetical protein